jgi:predicted ABC-type ATPase
MLAGPNGAGKSTFYDEFLRHIHLPFLNADDLERRLHIPSAQAARMLDAIRPDLVNQRTGFITETVFSDPVEAKLSLLRMAVDAGYEVILIYIGVDVELATKRVDQRVAAGGHDVPRDRIASRFDRSLANLRKAIRFVPVVKIYDNSFVDDPFRLIAIFESGKRSFKLPSIPGWAGSVLNRRH